MYNCPFYRIFSFENTSPSYSVLEGYEGLLLENQDNRIEVSPLKHVFKNIFYHKLNPLSFSRLMEE